MLSPNTNNRQCLSSYQECPVSAPSADADTCTDATLSLHAQGELPEGIKLMFFKYMAYLKFIFSLFSTLGLLKHFKLAYGSNIIFKNCVVVYRKAKQIKTMH